MLYRISINNGQYYNHKRLYKQDETITTGVAQHIYMTVGVMK